MVLKICMHVIYDICWKIENEDNGYTSPPEKTIQESSIKRRGSSIKVCFVNKGYKVVYSIICI